MKKQTESGNLIGIHQFTAYEGDIQLDRHGKIVNKVIYRSPKYKNMIVNNGKYLALDRIFGTGSPVPNPISYVGVGTDSTAPSVTQTELCPSNGGVDNGSTYQFDILPADTGYPSRNGQATTIQATFSTTQANFTWNEGGLFNGPTNGTSIMFNRAVIGPFTKTSNVAMVYSVIVSET